MQWVIWSWSKGVVSEITPDRAEKGGIGKRMTKNPREEHHTPSHLHVNANRFMATEKLLDKLVI